MDDIRNKVKESGLIALDMEDFLPTSRWKELDISEQLWQGLVLKEKEFRSWIKSFDWSLYQGQAVRIFCSTDAIVPTWAYMLLASALIPHTKQVISGSEKEMEQFLISIALKDLDTAALEGQRVIVKGCAKLKCQEWALTELVKTLQPVVKSLMFGEPCSTVPIYKKLP